MVQKKRLAALAALFVLFAQGCGKSPYADDAKWEEFRSEEGGFTALFPGKPSHRENSMGCSGGSATYTTYSMEHGDEGMGVGYCDFPEDLLRKVSTEKVFNAARDGAASQLKGSVVDDRMVSMYRATGREITIKVSEKRVGRARLLMVRNRMYIIMVTGTTEQVASEAAKKFFNSFEYHSGGRVATR